MHNTADDGLSTIFTTTAPHSSLVVSPSRQRMFHTSSKVESSFDYKNNNVTGSDNSAVSDVAKEQKQDERIRRCLLSVPGSDSRKINKAKTIGADTVVLDLEDGVAPDLKDQARDTVRQTLMEVDAGEFGSSELAVRINGLTSNESVQDLRAILSCPTLRAIVIPKVECPTSIGYINEQIDVLAPAESKDKIKIIAAIESAQGMINIQDIAQADNHKQNRLDALVFASEDYCADLELVRTPGATELLFARSQLVLTAKAYGLQAIDMVHIDFKNLDDLQRECQHGFEMGFTGKQAIHPNQIETIQRTFLPSDKDIRFALEICKAYEAAITGSDTTDDVDNNVGIIKGACVVQGIVVDAPVYKWAVKILKRAENAGILQEYLEKEN